MAHSRIEIDLIGSMDRNGLRYTSYPATDPFTDKALGLSGLGEGRNSGSPRGRLLVRNICSVFDRCLRNDRDTRRYSKTI